ncbi:DUF2971 domain-containing protein [Duganella dendranthematis]|uniref:DUF2971 domain-containing protein n=1 Tax=Duganella dendranthematis TaxID=2728021 RepID=A0ABX6M6G2_9BURK|nr:DUF2971 domain-containing protein [Duganella dendranthematis]QJD89902.1 DUF2971 domain-containing protein [Duganella dendranthematis]
MPLIYHYCDANALLNIVKNQKIWLSSLGAMNDTAEIKFFRDDLLTEINTELERLGVDQQIIDDLHKHIETYQFYAACFSTEKDDLYQWQSYGDRGQGFALGFNPDMLHEQSLRPAYQVKIEDKTVFSGAALSAERGSLVLAPVVYASKDKAREWAKQIAKVTESEMQRPSHGQMWEDFVRLVHIVSQVLKSDYFKAENEHRLIYVPVVNYDSVNSNITVKGVLDKREWRNGRYGLTPYFEFKYQKQSLWEIVTGPCCKEKDAANLLEFLRSYELGDVKITASKTTLR